jgi:hypothetical protein
MSRKLNILLEQRTDLSTAIDDLLTDWKRTQVYEGLQTNENVQWWWVKSYIVSKQK